MALRDLYDHAGEVLRPTEARDPFGDVATTYPTKGEIALALVPPSMGLRDMGPGDVSVDQLEGYTDADADIQARDMLRITEGPEAPSVWRVLGVRRPRGHHAEFLAQRYEGPVEDLIEEPEEPEEPEGPDDPEEPEVIE
jgi:hypothetical protein